MAQKSTTLYYKQLMAEIRKGEIRAGYFIYGEEGFLIDTLLDKLCHRFLSDPQKELNLFIRYASETSLEEILALTAGGSLFSEKKVIIFTDYQSARSPNTALLEKVFRNPNPDVCLVIVARTDTVNLAKFQSLRKWMTAVHVTPLREAELEQYISDQFSAAGKTAGSEAVKTMLYLVGEKIHDLKTEIVQVVNSLGDKTEVLPTDIERVVGNYVTQNVFQLTATIARKDLDKALGLLHQLLEKGENPGTIMALLIRHVLILLKMRGFYLSGEKNDRAVQEKLRIYPRHYSEYKRQLSQWRFENLKAALKLMLDGDMALKNGHGTPLLVLDTLVIKLARLN